MNMNQPVVVSANHNFVRSIVLDIVFTVLTCGLYNLWVQYKQIQTINFMLKTNKYSFLSWLFLCIITCGLYHIYHEFRKTEDICRAIGKDSGSETLITIVLTVLGMHVAADAIQQVMINKFFGNHDL